MRRFRLSKLADFLVVKNMQGDTDRQICGISYDSRKVKPGYIFFCLKGVKDDGHNYIEDAVKNGAAAVVVERDVEVKGTTRILVPDTRLALAALSSYYYGFPSSRLRLIGVTGTNGKTTTSHLIDAVLAKKAKVTGLLGTIRYRIGRESLPVIATTPEASDLQAMLAYMVEKGAKYATMEVSSHALQLQRVVGCEFDIAVLTNITEDHLDFHKTFADYFSAKGKLFSQLGSFVKSGCRKYAVINRDDQNFSKIANLTTAQIITYGLHETADVRGEIISLNNSGAVFKVLSFAGETILRLKMSGLFSVYNALAAFTLGLLEGVSSMKIKEALEAIEGIPGRFEMIYAGQDFLVIVDYAHTPDGLENVLRTVNEFAQGEIITVFGCGGERDESKRPLMGKIAGKYSDYCFITNDNPRREDPERIVQQILSGIKTVMPPTKYKVVLDRYQAISEAITRANTNDVIVIAGKGHENIQVFYDRCIPFNDRRVAMEIIKKMLQIGV